MDKKMSSTTRRPGTSPRRTVSNVLGEDINLVQPSIRTSPQRFVRSELRRSPRTAARLSQRSGSYNEMLGDTSISQMLLESGYAPLDKIVILNAQGAPEVKYIKAVNKLGQYVYVYLDSKGFISRNADDIVMSELRKAEKIPISLKVGINDCVASDVCGVAFECDKEVCTLIRDETSDELVEHVYVNGDRAIETTSPAEGELISYPIVRLSEIKNSPDAVLRNTNEVTKRLRNSSFNILDNELRETELAIASLVQSFNEFKIAVRNTSQQLNDSSIALEGTVGSLLQYELLDEHQKNLLKRAQYNLRARADMLKNEMILIEKVTKLKSAITQQSQFINGVTAALVKELEDAYYDVYPGDCK